MDSVCLLTARDAGLLEQVTPNLFHVLAVWTFLFSYLPEPLQLKRHFLDSVAYALHHGFALRLISFLRKSKILRLDTLRFFGSITEILTSPVLKVTKLQAHGR